MAATDASLQLDQHFAGPTRSESATMELRATPIVLRISFYRQTTLQSSPTDKNTYPTQKSNGDPPPELAQLGPCPLEADGGRPPPDRTADVPTELPSAA
jgi:hypothetical protein